MARELAIHFAETRAEFERADRALAKRFPAGLSRHIFPPPTFTEEQARLQQRELTATQVALRRFGTSGERSQE